MNIRDYGVIFDSTIKDILPSNWQSGVLRQRAKTTKAGKMLYVDSYPIWDTSANSIARRKLDELKRAGSTEAQRKLNIRNAKKRLTQKVNANFGENDLLCSCTYTQKSQPKDEREAKLNARNFVRRLKRLCKRKEISGFRYIYITEKTESKSSGTCFHHHLLMTGRGLPREEVEDCWIKVHGGICNTRRYQDQEQGLTGYASYMLKGLGTEKTKGQQLVGKRSWNCSKNLIEPTVTVADRKISLHRVERIARDIGNPDVARAVFEKLYPRYHFVDIEVRTSSFVGGVYIYATMKRHKRGRRSHVSERMMQESMV